MSGRGTEGKEGVALRDGRAWHRGMGGCGTEEWVGVAQRNGWVWHRGEGGCGTEGGVLSRAAIKA